MEIIKAEDIGFCLGSRAIKRAEDARQSTNKKGFMLGNYS